MCTFPNVNTIAKRARPVCRFEEIVERVLGFTCNFLASMVDTEHTCDFCVRSYGLDIWPILRILLISSPLVFSLHEFMNYEVVKKIILLMNVALCLSYPLNFGIYCGMSR